MSLVLLFEKLYKPIVFTLKQCGEMFLKTEAWWITKSDRTKDNVRWSAFVCILMVAAVFREIEIKESHGIDIHRNNSNLADLQKKNDFLEYRYVLKLEEDIRELKGIKEISQVNKEDIKTINDKDDAEEGEQETEPPKVVEE